MSPEEIQNRLDVLRALLPASAVVNVSIWSQPVAAVGTVAGAQGGMSWTKDREVSKPAGRVRIRVWPDSTYTIPLAADAAGWEEAFDEARTMVIAWSVERDLATVHRLAMALVESGGTEKAVTIQTLGAAGFTPVQVREHWSEACARARLIAMRAAVVRFDQMVLP